MSSRTRSPAAKATGFSHGSTSRPSTSSGSPGAFENPMPSPKSASNHTPMPWPVPARSTLNSRTGRHVGALDCRVVQSDAQHSGFDRSAERLNLVFVGLVEDDVERGLIRCPSTPS